MRREPTGWDVVDRWVPVAAALLGALAGAALALWAWR
jgi:hypothetical protein